MKTYKIGKYKNGNQRANVLSEHDTLEEAITELKRLFDWCVSNIDSFSEEEWADGQTFFTEDVNNYAIFLTEEDEPLITNYHFQGEKSSRI